MMPEESEDERIRRALQQARIVASEHSAEHAAGMRHAIVIIGTELLSDGDER